MLSDEIWRFLGEKKKKKKKKKKKNSESTIFIFTVCKKRAFYEFSTKILAKKV